MVSSSSSSSSSFCGRCVVDASSLPRHTRAHTHAHTLAHTGANEQSGNKHLNEVANLQFKDSFAILSVCLSVCLSVVQRCLRVGQAEVAALKSFSPQCGFFKRKKPEDMHQAEKKKMYYEEDYS